MRQTIPLLVALVCFASAAPADSTNGQQRAHSRSDLSPKLPSIGTPQDLRPAEVPTKFLKLSREIQGRPVHFREPKTVVDPETKATSVVWAADWKYPQAKLKNTHRSRTITCTIEASSYRQGSIDPHETWTTSYTIAPGMIVELGPSVTTSDLVSYGYRYTATFAEFDN